MLVLTPSFAQRLNLSLNLTEGSTYSHRSSASVLINQSVNGQPIDIKVKVDGAMDFTVAEKLDSVYSLLALYTSLTLTMDLPNMSMEFSSEKQDSSDVMSAVLGAMVGQPFRVRMTRQGRITEVKDIEMMFSNAFDQFPQLTDTQREQILGQLSQSFGESAFKGNLEMVTAIFPDRPVAVGDTWDVQTQLEAGMAARVNTTYTLKEVSPSHFHISGSSTLDTEDKDAYVEANGMPMKYNLKGTMTSTIKVAQTTGWISDAKMVQDIGGTAEIKDNPQVPGGMVIPMTMKSETIITDKQMAK